MEILSDLKDARKLEEISDDMSPKKIIINSKDFTKKGILNIKKLKQTHTIIFDATNSDQTRIVVEKGLADIIINSEFHNEKDYTYQPNSGLDYVICNIMSKKGIKYGFMFDKIKIGLNNQSKILFSRITQNVFLCKKHKVEIVCDNKLIKAFID